MKRRAEANRKSAEARPNKSSKLKGRTRQKPTAKRGSSADATAASLCERLFPLASRDVMKVVGHVDLGVEDLPGILLDRPVHLAQSSGRYSERNNVT